MRIHSGKKVWPAALFLLLGILLLGTYVARREIFLLNRNVRLICFRLLKYRELARHRAYIYRIQFFADQYRVDACPFGQNESWREVAVFPYEKGIETDMPEFTLVIDRGRTVSFDWDKKTRITRPNVILTFFHKKKPGRRRGVQCFRDGFCRILKG